MARKKRVHRTPVAPATSAYGVAAAAPAAPSRSGWILSPFWDSFLFIGAPLVCMAAFLPLRRFFTSEQIAIFLLAFFTFGHHLPGFIRAYGDKELFARYRLRFLLAPPLIFATTLWFDLKGLHGLIIFVFAWDIWHVLMQHYGFMRIYDAKRGEISKLTARLDWAVSISWYVSLIVASPHYRHNLLLHGYTTGIPLIPTQVFQALEVSLYALTGILTLAYAAYNVHLWRQDRLNPRKLVLLGTFLVATYYLYVFLDDFLVGFVVWSAFHCIQYYGIVWAFNVNRVARGSPLSGFVRFLFRPRTLLVLIYAGLILAYGGINYLQSFVWDETALRLLLAFVFTSNALHYYYDGFIWKVREPETRKYLDIGADEDTEKTGLAAASASLGKAVRQLNPVNRGWLQAAYLAAIVAVLAAFETWKPPDSLSIGQALVALAPDVGDAHYTLGNALWEQGRLDEAEAEYREAVRLTPGSAKAHNNLGGLLLEKGRFDEAIEHFRQALVLQGDRGAAHRAQTDSPLAPVSRAGEAANLFVIHSNLANALVQKGAAEKALEHYRRALEIDPAAAQVRANLGATLAGLGRAEEGIRELRQALDINPNHAGAHLLLASVLSYHGDVEQALPHYRKALEFGDDTVKGAQAASESRSPQRVSASYAQAHVNVGVALARLGRIDDAVSAYRRAVGAAPNFSAAHFNLAGLLESRGETEQALEHYRKAAAGDNPEARRLALAAIEHLGVH